MSYFAAALARTDLGWTGVELDLSEIDDLEALTDLLRDLTDDGPGPALLLLEQDDEHVAVVRVDGGPGTHADPRIFLSDRRAVQGSDVVAMLWADAEVDLHEQDAVGAGTGENEVVEGEELDDEDEASLRLLVEPVGDASLLVDLGTPADVLINLCAEEGLLPADVITALCERAGCLDLLEQLREA